MEYKVVSLAELGKLEEALKYAENLTAESEIKTKIVKLWQIIQNKPDNPEETAIIKMMD